MEEGIVFILFSIYGGLLFLSLRNLWIGIEKPITNLKFQPSVAVVVAFRNEENNIKSLITSILNQNYQNFTLHLVNDHSHDKSLEVINTISDDRLFIHQLPDDKTGKKAALEWGVSKTDTEIIFLTDADCTMNMNWLSHSVKYFINEKLDWQLGLVTYKSNGSFLGSFQQFESISAVLLSHFSIQINTPLTANGANICFYKKDFDELNGYQGFDKIVSGDDEQLMFKFHEQNKKLGSCLYPETIVQTESENTWNGFMHQRIRWAGKMKQNFRFHSISLSVFLLIINLLPWCLFVSFPVLGICALLVKFLIDLVFLGISARTLKNVFFIHHFIMMFFVYPFYITFMSIMALRGKFEWKGRNLR